MGQYQPVLVAGMGGFGSLVVGLEPLFTTYGGMASRFGLRNALPYGVFQLVYGPVPAGMAGASQLGRFLDCRCHVAAAGLDSGPDY